MLKTIILSLLLYNHYAESYIVFRGNGSNEINHRSATFQDVNSNTIENESFLEIPSCLSNETYFKETGTCVGILSREPCPVGQWVVVSEATEVGECRPHPEACMKDEDEEEGISDDCIDAALKLQNGSNNNEGTECDRAVMTPVFTNYGSVMCICNPGLLYSRIRDSCYDPFEQGPCEDGEYINVVVQKTNALETSMLEIKEAEMNKILDDKMNLSFVGGHISTTAKPAASTSLRRSRRFADISQVTKKKKQRKTNTTKSKAKAKDVTTTTVSTTTPTTPSTITNHNVDVMEDMNEVETYEYELVCTANPCKKGHFPLNISLLKSSPNANISSNEENENIVVCDSIGSFDHCQDGFPLGFNTETFAIDCVGAEIMPRSAMNKVKQVGCLPGKRLSRTGKCVKEKAKENEKKDKKETHQFNSPSQKRA